MTVLVTGGTGFIGSHVVEAMVARGDPVRCLVRSLSRPNWLANLDVDLVEGQFDDRDRLTRALGGVRTVVHAAAATWAPDAAAFYRANVAATESLLDACVRAGTVDRFVLVSSQAAAGPGTREAPLTERSKPRPVSAYGRSKLDAENRCRERSGELPITILRPSAVYGPRDRGFLPYFRLAKRGILIEFGHGPRELSLCHVNDLVRVIVRAADSYLPSGSVYFVADLEPYQWADVESLVCTLLGVKGRRIVIPGAVLKTLGAIGQAYGAISSRTVTLNRERATDLLEKHWVCDSSAAVRDLGFAPGTTIENGLREAVRWYEQNSWL